MPMDDFNPEQSGQIGQFNDPAHQQGQGHTHAGVPGSSTDPVDTNNQVETERPSDHADEHQTAEVEVDRTEVDNLPPDDTSAVDEIDSDLTTEGAGADDVRKLDIELDDDADVYDDQDPAVDQDDNGDEADDEADDEGGIGENAKYS
jgi:hypothetical protein